MSQKTTKKTSQQKVDLQRFIIRWNSNFPIDFLWRQKYGVAFGSEVHRQMSFIDMTFDIQEERMMNNLFRKRKENLEKEQNKYALTDEEFDKIDLNQFNIQKDL
jgi:hypothetical protein